MTGKRAKMVAFGDMDAAIRDAAEAMALDIKPSGLSEVQDPQRFLRGVRYSEFVECGADRAPVPLHWADGK